MANFIPSGSGGGSGMRESLVERQAKINAACSSFIKIGFPRDLFTINNLLTYGFTENKFLEFIRPFSYITDMNVLRYLFNTARKSFLFDPTVKTPTEFCEFVNCVNWLRSEPSSAEKKEMSKADVAIAQMILASAAPFIQERKRIQSEIVELKRRQEELETECANISAELKLKLGPIYDYEEPSVTELRIESYLLYEGNCISRGIAIPTLDEMGFANVVDVFGGLVKERHLVKYLNDPVRKELIETYFKGFAPRW